MAETSPSTNLFIGSLPATLDKAGLQALFKDYGTILDCRVLPSKDNGMTVSAMARFSTQEEATWLVENLNGNMPEGLDSPIVVRYAYANKGGGDWSKGGGDWGKGGGDWGKGGADWGKGGADWGKGGADWGKGGGDMGKGGGDMGKGGGDWGKNGADLGKGDKGGDWGGKGGGDWGGKGDWGKGMQSMWAMMAAMKGKGMAGKGEKGGKPPSFEALYNAVTEKFGAMKAPLENQVYIENLPTDTTDHSLYRLFAPFGAIAPNGVRAMVDPATGLCKGFGFVDFVQPEAAASAVMQLNDFACPDGSVIRCNLKSERKGKGKGKDAKAGANGGGGVVL